ncbi:unnamed protein product, partial [Prorocentrum cordatum]
MRAKIQGVTLDDCEGSGDMKLLVVHMLRNALDDFQKFRYLEVVPWRFAMADDPGDAREVLRQVGLRPLADHDPVTRQIFNAFGDDLRALADGAPCSPALAAELRALRNCPLDEPPGEGWHRHASYEKHRATCTRLLHIKASIRLKENLAKVKQFVLKHKSAGRAAVEYEWRHCKRILQVHTRRAKQNVRSRSTSVHHKIYRMDDAVTDDWGSLVEVWVASPAAPVVVPAIGSELLRNEFALATFTPGSVFSVAGTRFFQIVRKTTSKSRPHLVPTVEDADDLKLTSPLVLYIQSLEIWRDNRDRSGGLELYSDCDPMWVLPSDVAPGNALFRSVQRWTVVSASEA